MKTHAQYMEGAQAAIAECLRLKELFGLDEVDLGFAARPPKTSARASKGAKRKAKQVIRYRDGNGGEWSGKGHQPRWITDSGKGKEHFRVAGT